MDIKQAIRSYAGLGGDEEVADDAVEKFRAIDLRDGNAARPQIRALVLELYGRDMISPQVFSLYQALAVDQVTR